MVGTSDDDLPSSSSRDLVLRHPTLEECVAIWKNSSVAWVESLTPSLYLEESLYLTTVPVARDGGLTIWILVHKDQAPGERHILCSCESFYKRSLTSDSNGVVSDNMVHTIASVFCAPPYRRRGYASRMMSEMAKVLYKWQKETLPCMGTTLYSDIGKEYYAQLGWHPNATNLHVEIQPEAISWPSIAKPVTEEDLEGLCRRDEVIVRSRMAVPTEEIKTRFTIIPDLDNMYWHFAKETFACNHLFGKLPTVKGAIVGSPGNQMWALWAHRYYGRHDVEPKNNVLYILRSVLEIDETATRLPSDAAKRPAQEVYEEQVESLKAILQAAQAEASEWKLDVVRLWDPSPLVSELMDRTGIQHTIVERGEESIASLLWYDTDGSIAKDTPFTFVAAISVQADVFEPTDFNVTQALIENGVDVSAVPQLLRLAEQTPLNGCFIACFALKAVYGNNTILSNQTLPYNAFLGTYWSGQQADIEPLCVFEPAKATEVSSMVLISRLTQCPFAVRGGSHAAFAGASNIKGGITVSMKKFNTIAPSIDGKYADVGPGNRWFDVYTALEKHGLGVVGGRIATVGVPGLILGGGISFFSNKLGWACDNVAAYEVVTACGRIVTATPTDYPELFWALRGGSGNFGIVTNFKLDAFPLGLMWGGQRIFLESNFTGVLDALYDFAVTGSSTDTDAAEIASFGYVPSLGGKISAVNTQYAKPVAHPPIFDPIRALKPIADDTSFGSLANLTAKMNNNRADEDLGLRQTFWDISLKVDRELYSFLVDTFYTNFPIIQSVESILPFISIQAITEGQLKGMQKNGGNALGLGPVDGPLFIMSMSAWWAKASDDAAVMNFFSTVTKTVKAYAKSKNLDNGFIYINYASTYQDPLASYGSANVQKLIAISKKFDPMQVFQNLSPGYFKLGQGAPDKNMP
ncbi:GlcD FAD FMN-containing dehydrogenase [Pyrenophora tritici-repentis]|nr:GlcD FAD FMN-containing dehydrogenase [Pyrenophora tritici-repentis]